MAKKTAPSGKKTTAAGKKKAVSSQKTKLQNELKKIIKDINEEGLLFLIEQANVIKYNMQIEKINKLQASQPKQNSFSKTTANYKITIKAEDNNQNFIVTLGTEKKFFSREDFRGMVLVCQSKDPIVEVSKRLYGWLDRERRDILIDLGINSTSHQLLKNLIKEVKSKYKAKTR